jgi:hypothetical protein
LTLNVYAQAEVDGERAAVEQMGSAFLSMGDGREMTPGRAVGGYHPHSL